MEVKKGDIVTISAEVQGVVREEGCTLVKLKIDDEPHGIWIDAKYLKTIRPMGKEDA